MKNKLTVKFAFALIIFFSSAFFSVSNASYTIDCGGGPTTCPCDQCPSSTGYTCPGGSGDQCLKIGCTCNASTSFKCVWSGATWSSCNGGVTTPPPTTPPSGGSCTASCLNASPGQNCGDINGSQSQPGSCSPGQLCCGFGGGGGGGGVVDTCFITTTGPFHVNLGAQRNISISYNLQGGKQPGDATFRPAGPIAGDFIVLPGYTPDKTRPYQTRIEGTRVGTRQMRVGIAVPGGTSCSKDIPIIVDPAVPIAVDLKANGSDGPVTVAAGTNATLSWTVTGPAGTVCSASNGWSGNKSLVGSEPTSVLNTDTTFTLQCSSGAITGEDSVDVNVSSLVLEPGWWQAGNGHVVTQGNIISRIPDPSKVLVEDGAGTYPGVVLRSIAGSIDTGSGIVSSTQWAARSILNGIIPDYTSFENLIPTSIVPTDPGSNVNQAGLNSGGVTVDGYTWYKRDGDLNISGNVALNAGRKVILFVDGDVTISGTISYSPSNSMLIIIARGDISVAPSVTSPSNTYTLTGIFYSDGQFITGSSASRLSVLGSVVAMNGLTLGRDLGPSNLNEPAEKFTLSADLIANYPSSLTFKHPSWSEVAP